MEWAHPTVHPWSSETGGRECPCGEYAPSTCKRQTLAVSLGLAGRGGVGHVSRCTGQEATLRDTLARRRGNQGFDRDYTFWSSACCHGVLSGTTPCSRLDRVRRTSRGGGRGVRQAAQRATSATIRIVMSTAADPVGQRASSEPARYRRGTLTGQSRWAVARQATA